MALEADKGKEINSSLGASRSNVALLTFLFPPGNSLFGLLMSRSVRKHVCVVSSHEICHCLLQQLQKTHTVFFFLSWGLLTLPPLFSESSFISFTKSLCTLPCVSPHLFHGQISWQRVLIVLIVILLVLLLLLMVVISYSSDGKLIHTNTWQLTVLQHRECGGCHSEHIML